MPPTQGIPEDFNLNEIDSKDQTTTDEQITTSLTSLGDDWIETYLATVSIREDSPSFCAPSSILEDSSPFCATSFSQSCPYSYFDNLRNVHEFQPWRSGGSPFDFLQSFEDDMEIEQVYRELGSAIPEPLPPLQEYTTDAPRPKKRKIDHEDTWDQPNSNATVLPSFYSTFMSPNARNQPNSNATVLSPIYPTYMSPRSIAENLLSGPFYNITKPISKATESIVKYSKFIAKIGNQKTIIKTRLSANLSNLLGMVQVLWGELRCNGCTSPENTKKLFQYINQEIQETEGRGIFLLYRSNQYQMHYWAPKPKYHVISKDKKSRGNMTNDIPNSKYGRVEGEMACPRRRYRVQESFYRCFLRTKMEKKLKQSPNEVHRILRTHYPEYRIVSSEVEAVYVRFGLGKIFENGSTLPCPISEPKKMF